MVRLALHYRNAGTEEFIWTADEFTINWSIALMNLSVKLIHTFFGDMAPTNLKEVYIHRWQVTDELIRGGLGSPVLATW
jgi:hypothetical protein